MKLFLKIVPLIAGVVLAGCKTASQRSYNGVEPEERKGADVNIGGKKLKVVESETGKLGLINNFRRSYVEVYESPQQKPAVEDDLSIVDGANQAEAENDLRIVDGKQVGSPESDDELVYFGVTSSHGSGPVKWAADGMSSAIGFAVLDGFGLLGGGDDVTANASSDPSLSQSQDQEQDQGVNIN